MRVAEHFQDDCWAIIERTGHEVGFLGRVGKSLGKASNHEGTGRAEVTSLAHPHLGCRSSHCEAWEEKPLPSIIGQVGSPFLISGCLPSPSPGPSGKLTMVFRPGELEQLDTGAWPLPFSHSV